MPTYNIVNQGADNTGGTAIDSVLDRLVGSNTTINFPPGTYKLNDILVASGTENLTLRAPDGARLVPGRSGNVRWIEARSNGFVLDGFELDMRNVVGPPFIKMDSAAGNWELKRLVTRGKVRSNTDTNVGSNNSSDARTFFRLSAAQGTRGLLQDCYFHEGSATPTQASNTRAILIESSSGAISLNRCWFELWGENTIYAKKPAGKLNIFNCYFRNTQNGMRLGGNTELNNCVSIKNAQHPQQAWSGGSLQKGVNVEATDATNSAAGIDSYNGTLTVADSDFNHRYLDPSCRGAIAAPVPCERIDIRNCRISYNSTKLNEDALYTRNGKMSDGTPANLEYLQLSNVQVRNDYGTVYGIAIDQAPDTWGTVSGTIGGSGMQTNSSYVENRMTTNGSPTAPNTTPPLPSPPPLGQVPLQSASLVRIDNSGNSSATTFDVRAGTYIGPAGDNGATLTTTWASSVSAKRPPNSRRATGTVPAGRVYAFYVTGGVTSATKSGPATLTVDGQPYTSASAASMSSDGVADGNLSD
ncbi:hypothetical protein SAMN05421858_2365 [Haladaptatus litoreus]|uniref:Right handed beta helix region n=1 Tax=Haladaptatus litoreus TaxID=553468 RepID=A0A1N7B6F6_9EURY|nr:hypothetical protein [Haladaptatus litoreus]SIR46876.1 hypothetical protein SAMN05421858_2365 [Haladaptatus litoreus]